jgi:hypothetical protein
MTRDAEAGSKIEIWPGKSTLNNIVEQAQRCKSLRLKWMYPSDDLLLVTLSLRKDDVSFSGRNTIRFPAMCTMRYRNSRIPVTPIMSLVEMREDRDRWRDVIKGSFYSQTLDADKLRTIRFGVLYL